MPQISSTAPIRTRGFHLSAVKRAVALAAVLFVGTLILYLPALRNNFVNYDDDAYVTANAHVLQGLSWSNVRWALTATEQANWHPATWISHMADVQLFGLDPRGHHAVSTVAHATNVVLLFLALLTATGSQIRSTLLAALFAVHPLNVECVAWAAERKSLLSMLFFLLALLVYERYARRKSLGLYLAVVALFALALAAKPMVVTFPVLLLLFDYWPLQRLAQADTSARAQNALLLVREKIPLFVMSAASAWITFRVQRSGGAVGSGELLPLGWRLQNAVYSYFSYVEKGAWPARLAVFYPHPEASLGLSSVLGAAALIAVITLACWLCRARNPYLLTGWLWYLLAMMPMIGLVQVGRQAMADRYAYLPFIGLFMMTVWGCADLFASFNVLPVVRNAVAAAVLLVYASMTFLQIHYWHSSYTLFSHALQVTERNGIAEDNLGVSLMEAGRPDLALPHFQAAAQFIPQLSTAHYNLGVLAQQQNHLEAAQREYELALKYSIDADEIAQAHSNLGFLLLDNDPQRALLHFDAALQVHPDKANALLGRGIANFKLANPDRAVADLSRAAQLRPFPQADYWLGRALEVKGHTQAAAAAYEAALRLAPDLAEAQERLQLLRNGQTPAGTAVQNGHGKSEARP